MKRLIYLLAGIVFGIGLSLSGMIDAQKVIGFLNIGSAEWNPALIFVLGSAVPVYFVAFYWTRKRGKTLNGNSFGHPPVRPVDRKLIIGSAIFGAGWGLAGVCPGPALTHLAFLDLSFGIFLIALFVGFEIHRRTS
jgi:uncharacterized membrane protein YedE/YeeE